tara:strand:+ start:713 stop:1009 length:297 start_codon:yes stop_codon:yes gene_type:complete
MIVKIEPHPAKHPDGSQVHKGLFQIRVDGVAEGTTYGAKDSELVMLRQFEEDEVAILQREGRAYFDDNRTVWMSIPSEVLETSYLKILDEEYEDSLED